MNTSTRLELHLADKRSVGDVEALINRRSLRLWPSGLDAVKLQSDYRYRRLSPKWIRPDFTLDASNFGTPVTARLLAQIAEAAEERPPARANDQAGERARVAAIVERCQDAADRPIRELLPLLTLVLGTMPAAQMSSILQERLLPAIFHRYPHARLAFVAIDAEANQRLADMTLLHLYERRSHDEVNRAVLKAGFFPQVQGGFSPVRLVANALTVLAGFFYPWLYFVPISRPGGVFLLSLGEDPPFDLGLESPSTLETLGFGLGQIHGLGLGRVTDLTRFIDEPPTSEGVERLILALVARLNDLLVALYDISEFGSLGQQLSACFTTARLFEESATGLLTTNPYLRKVTFFNVWDKVTCVQKGTDENVRESELKSLLVQPKTLQQIMLKTIPPTLPLWPGLCTHVFGTLLEELQTTLVAGVAPWVSSDAASRSDAFPASLLVDYRNTVHGYRRDHIDDFLSHGGFIPDSVVYLAFFWCLSVICAPVDFLRGRWMRR